MTPTTIQSASSPSLAKPNILLIGSGGSGKTTLLRTLPGRTFVFVTDPNSLQTLQGTPNLDFAYFPPDALQYNVQVLSNAKREHHRARSQAALYASATNGSQSLHEEPTAYQRLEAFSKTFLSSHLPSYDNIAFDSCTTLGNIIMDRVLFENDHPGRHPEQADYTAQMAALLHLLRAYTAIPDKVVIALAHEELRSEGPENSGAPLLYQPIFVGKNRISVPILFSEVFHTFVDTYTTPISYKLRTTHDNLRQYVRSTLHEEEIDVTLPLAFPSIPNPESFGLARILATISESSS